MAEQLNFLDEMERESKERKRFEEKTMYYNKWLALPEITYVPDGSEQRGQVRSDLWIPGIELYQDAHHECENMPADEYVWLNAAASIGTGEFWVLNKKEKMGGDHIEICPYCGSNLAEGRGDVVLHKADEQYWRGYLYYDIPKHEGRKQTRFERLMSYHSRKTPDEVMEIYRAENRSAETPVDCVAKPRCDYER